MSFLASFYTTFHTTFLTSLLQTFCMSFHTTFLTTLHQSGVKGVFYVTVRLYAVLVFAQLVLCKLRSVRFGQSFFLGTKFRKYNFIAIFSPFHICPLLTVLPLQR